jgi:ferric-dicitrate binding protein FerR (iron transport regulator)
MMNADKGEFGVRELICDPFFQDWVLRPTEEHEVFWTAWRKEHPDKDALVQEAAGLLRSLDFAEDFPSEAQVQASLSRTLGTLQARKVNMVWRVAAICTGIALCAGLFYYTAQRRTPREQASVTPYGQIRTLYLPDSSKVVLNAHSSVRYASAWRPGQPREVWLEGEAYFDVRPVESSGFLVHVKDLTVEVLGTAFDIRDRRGKVEVVLEKGKIRVRYIGGDLVMAPGDRALFD